MAEISEDLLRKIKNIQELSQRGGTQHEAAAAAGKLTELLLRHNLTLLDLDQVSDERNIKVSEQMFWLSAVSNWRRELLNQVARANGCRILIYSGTRAVRMIGYPHNIITVVNFYQWLEPLFDSIVKEEKEKLKDRSQWPRFDSWDDLNTYGHIGLDMELAHLEQSRRLLLRSPQSWSRSFRFGMVAGIADKMQAARKKVILTDSKALVSLMEQEVDDYIDALDIKTSKKKISVSTSAQHHGYRRGQQINIDPQLPGSPRDAVGG